MRNEMGIYTNNGLVTHARNALGLRTKYMWGGILRPITADGIAALKKLYSGVAGTGYTPGRWEELSALAGKGYYGCDCVGLIKSYYWSGRSCGGTGSPKYGAAGFPDVNAGGMYAAARIKGGISALPETPGLILYSRSRPHVGIYAGNGNVLECTYSTRGDGVVGTRLGDFGWEYWFECPYITYESGLTGPAAIKRCTLAFPAAVRSKPSPAAGRIGRYTAGSTVTVVCGSETLDKASGYTYIRVAAEREMWIVKSALKASERI